MSDRILLSWSGGKDSAQALFELRSHPRYDGFRVDGLLTCLTAGYDRISGHGVRRTVLERQARQLGLPLRTMYIPQRASMEQYDREVERSLCEAGSDRVAFGDIFLKDVKKRRLDALNELGAQGVFPLWGRDSAELARALLGRGFKAFVVCVDSNVLDSSFVGKPFDAEFLDRLPRDVDPCGEGGEFHTFVYDGPGFSEPVPCQMGETVLRDSFYFTDLLC